MILAVALAIANINQMTINLTVNDSFPQFLITDNTQQNGRILYVKKK